MQTRDLNSRLVILTYPVYFVSSLLGRMLLLLYNSHTTGGERDVKIKGSFGWLVIIQSLEGSYAFYKFVMKCQVCYEMSSLLLDSLLQYIRRGEAYAGSLEHCNC